MKVLMLGWEFPPRITGGLGTACQGLAEGLVRRGVDLTLVVPSARDVRAPDGARLVGCERAERVATTRSDPARERRAARRRLAFLRVPAELAPYGTPEPERSAGTEPHEDVAPDARGGARPPELRGGYGPALFREVELFARRALERTRGFDFDLVHAHDWMTWPAAALVARARRRPFVAHVHSCELDRAGGPGDPRVRAAEQWGLDAADRVVCVSRFGRAVLTAGYRVDAGKVRVVHNGVRAPRAAMPRARHPLGGPLVLFLGRVTAQKGVDDLLEAARLVVHAEPSARFLVCGEGDLWPRAVERVAELGLARRVHFAGFVEGLERERAFALADAFVLPSTSEPFGLAALEAVARGVPAVLSRRSGASEVLRSAPTHEVGDAAELAGHVLALLCDPARRAELVRRGRAELAHRRWERSAAALQRVFAELGP